MKQVCVLGNGQLGRMLRQAGEPLGIAVWPVGLDAEPARSGWTLNRRRCLFNKA